MTDITIVLADDNPKILEMATRFVQPPLSIIARVDDGDSPLKVIQEL